MAELKLKNLYQDFRDGKVLKAYSLEIKKLAQKIDKNIIIDVGHNVLAAKAAIDAGCKFFGGYPLTPSSEIAHQMSKDLPKNGGKIFVSLSNMDKQFAPKIASGLIEQGFNIVATSGTFDAIVKAGFDCEKVLKVSQGRPNITDSLKNEEIVMAINTSDGKETSVDDGLAIRRTVLKMNIPYVTTVAGALASVEAIKSSVDGSNLKPKSIQEFLQ